MCQMIFQRTWLSYPQLCSQDKGAKKFFMSYPAVIHDVDKAISKDVTHFLIRPNGDTEVSDNQFV